VFESDMRLAEAVLIPVDVVREHMGWSSTWRAHRLALTQRLLKDHRTARLSADAVIRGAVRR